MTDMREKLANVITNAIITQGGEDPITLPDNLKLAWLDQGEIDMGAVAQAAITALWPLAMEEAAKAAEGDGETIPLAAMFAPLVSGNNQPCMSGDPRDRLPPHKRRQFDDATHELAAAIRNRKAPL